MPKIMVVDDDPAGQRLIKYMLTPEGYEVITASNGILGLQMATQQSPDLVILDVMLPGLDGFEVCRRLRTGAATSGIPIIMLSGKTQASDRETGIKMGANEYLVKPVERHSLIEIVNNLLSQNREKAGNTAKLCALIGIRGGAGTSTIATSVAVSLEKAGKSTILVDLTPSYSSLADMIGVKAERSIAGLFKDASGTLDVNELKNLFVNHSTGLKLLWGESYPDESDTYTKDDVRMLLSELGNLAEYIIVDVPSSPTDHAITALSLADSVILVIPAGKESAERVENSITRLTRFGIDQDKLSLVAVDRTGNSHDISIGDRIGGFPLIGLINFCEKECSEAEAEATPVVLYAPSAQISNDMKDLAEYLISKL